ncbi:hypothetical protein, partial [Reinekea sp. G2M2-21]|uniref:hypothetical protein n=1 Tax=Reinekea sp. G2M2-21 TaxID=2788942 RepID=UPI001E46CE88
ANLPESWGSQQVKEWLIESAPKSPEIGECFHFGTGLWGHVVPLGMEFAGFEAEDFYRQIIVSIRTVDTELNAMIKLDLS